MKKKSLRLVLIILLSLVTISNGVIGYKVDPRQDHEVHQHITNESNEVSSLISYEIKDHLAKNIGDPSQEIDYPTGVLGVNFVCNADVEVWYLSAAQLTASNVIATDTWQQVVCMYDINSRNLSIFVNGKLKASTIPISDPVFNQQPLFIGWRGNNVQNFSGQIDEVMWWNRSLSDEEVSQLYDLGVQYSPAQAGAQDKRVYGFATMEASGTSASTPITFGGGASTTAIKNGMYWNGTVFQLQYPGLYKINMKTRVTSLSGFTTFTHNILVNGTTLESATDSAANSTIDPFEHTLEWWDCLDENDNVSVTIDSTTATTIAFAQTSQLTVERVDKDCSGW